jgi:hypothetical protein
VKTRFRERMKYFKAQLEDGHYGSEEQLLYLIRIQVRKEGKQLKPSSSCKITKKYGNIKTKKTKLHGLSPRANYTDRATAACRRSDCQLVRIEGATWSACRIPPAVFLGFLDRSSYFSI